MSSLFYPYRFGDSVLFTADSLPLESLPLSINSTVFKILPNDSIRAMMRADSNIQQLPNYLAVSAFEKSDTGYYVHIESLSFLPYGGGGSIGINIKKVRDSFIVVNTMSWSIN